MAATQRRRATPAIPNLDLVRTLSETVAVSGDEGPIRRLVIEAITPHVDSVTVDPLGTVLAVKAASTRSPSRAGRRDRVMLAAHMDEIGFMITGVDGEGALRFDVVGGVDDRQWIGKPVWVGPERVPGVISAAPMHLLNAERRLTVIRTANLRIDIGASSEKQARSWVQVGQRGTFASSFSALGPARHPTSLRGKALDDRLGVATLIELLQGERYACDLCAAFTVQEEIGLRGAKVAAYTFDPTVGVALDCTPASDLPPSQSDGENTRYNTRLGAGPALYVADAYTVGDRRLLAYFERTADAEGLTVQRRQPGGGGTDAGAIHRSRAGIPSLSISVPGRYLHGAYGLVRTADWRGSVDLMRAALTNWPGLRALRSA